MSSVVIAPTRPRAPAVAEREGRGASRLRSALSSRVYLPALAIPAVAAILIAIGWTSGWGGADFGGSVTSLRTIVIGPLTLAIIGVFLVVERVRPAQRRPLVARGHRHDVLYTALNATILVPLVTALTLSFVQVVRTAAPWIVLPRIGTVPRWGAIALIVVAMDACNWFVHLANHRVRLLWRFHELHHSQEDMSVLTVFRTHPLIHVSYLVALIPGVVLLANGVMSTAVLVVYACGRRVRPLEHQPRIRAARADLRQPELPPHPPQGRRPAGRQPRFRAHDLGSALRPRDLPDRGHDPDRHRAPGRPLIVEQAGPRPRHLAVFAAQLVAPFRPMRGASDGPQVRSAMSSTADERVANETADVDEQADVDERRVASW